MVFQNIKFDNFELYLDTSKGLVKLGLNVCNVEKQVNKENKEDELLNKKKELMELEKESHQMNKKLMNHSRNSKEMSIRGNTYTVSNKSKFNLNSCMHS